MINYKKKIAKNICNIVNIPEEELERYIEVPPNSEMGDYSFPCFKLAKELKKSPMAIAEEISGKIKSDEELFERIENTSGYLNLFVNKEKLVEQVLNEVENKK